MKRNKLLPIVLCILFLSNGLLAQEKTPLKVLFVGNSYTYFWNLPQQVQAMASAKGYDISTRQSTAGGVNWGQHWRGEKGLNTRALIEAGGWNIVVLQNHSTSTIERQDSFMIYGKKFAELVESIGAKPMLYMSWARAFNPLMQEQITAGYQALAKEIDAPIVPVGAAWEMARTLRPDLQLFDPDGSHPSPIGTYLAACTFFRALTGESPQGLPERLVTEDKDGEKLYLNFVAPNDAIFLQQVVDKVFQAKN